MTRSEFEHIATALRQKVLKVCFDFWRSKEDAEDAAQETMVQLWRYCDHIDAERNIAALAGNRGTRSMFQRQQQILHSLLFTLRFPQRCGWKPKTRKKC